MDMLPVIVGVVLVFVILVELSGVILTLIASGFIIWYIFVHYGDNAAQGAALCLAIILLISKISPKR